MKSYNPNDVKEGFCGNCHRWTFGEVTDPVRDDRPLMGEFIGEWGYRPGYMDEMTVRRVLGEISDEAWEELLAKLAQIKAITGE